MDTRDGERGRHRFRGLALGLAVALGGLVTFAAPTLTTAQRRTSLISISRVRSYFDEMERAWRELLAIEPQPADADGAIASWDRAWTRRVARVERLAIGTCLDLLADELASPADCSLRERGALLCGPGPAFMVSTRRATIYDAVLDVGDLPDPFETRRAIAHEAARRRAERLSCEDLPDDYELVQDACGRWYTHDGRALVPGSPPPVSPGTAGGCASDSGSVSPDGTEPLSREEIAAFIDRERSGLTRCWETAVRGISPVPSLRLDVALAIDPSGTVTNVAVSGEGVGTLATCVERTVLRWRFRVASGASAVTFPVAFSDAPDADTPPP